MGSAYTGKLGQKCFIYRQTNKAIEARLIRFDMITSEDEILLLSQFGEESVIFILR